MIVFFCPSRRPHHHQNPSFQRCLSSATGLARQAPPRTGQHLRHFTRAAPTSHLLGSLIPSHVDVMTSAIRIAFVPFSSPLQLSRSINNAAYFVCNAADQISCVGLGHVQFHSRILGCDMTPPGIQSPGNCSPFSNAKLPIFFPRVAGPRLSARRLPRLRSFQPSEGLTVRRMFCSVQRDRQSHVL